MENLIYTMNLGEYPIPATNHNMPNTRLGRRKRVGTRRTFYNEVDGVLWLAHVAKSHNLKIQGFGAYAKEPEQTINSNKLLHSCDLVAGIGE